MIKKINIKMIIFVIICVLIFDFIYIYSYILGVDDEILEYEIKRQIEEDNLDCNKSDLIDSNNNDIEASLYEK